MIIIVCAIFLSFDLLYSLYYFDNTYRFDLKRRFAEKNEDLPIQYRNQLRKELQVESGGLKIFVQFLYWPWVICSCFTSIWYLPIAISLSIILTNLIYRSTYISPIILFINLIVMLVCFVYSIVYLLPQFIK